MLTLIRQSQNPRKAIYRCHCGAECEVFRNNASRGHTTSCGCERARLASIKLRTHGSTSGGRTKGYVAWMNMRARCQRPSNKSFADYGARGITVCPEWQDFAVFIADMGEPPAGAMLDRIDNERGYSKSNCRWTTRKVQNNNKRSVPLYGFQGEKLCLNDIAKRIGMNAYTLRHRIRTGMPFERAISERGQLKTPPTNCEG